MVFTSTTAWKPENWIFFQKSLKFEIWLLTKSWNHLSFVNISPTLVIDTSMEWSSRVLHHGNPKMWNFFKKFEIDEIELKRNAEKRNRPGFGNICPTSVSDTSTERSSRNAEKRNRPGFGNISPTSVSDASTERSSRVLQHENQEIWFFFSKKFEIEFDLYFDLCWKA